MPKRKTLLVEVDPHGLVTVSDPIPVLVHLRYVLPSMGDVEDHPAEAVGWTASEVLVRWGSTPVEVWVPAGDVRRATRP